MEKPQKKRSKILKWITVTLLVILGLLLAAAIAPVVNYIKNNRPLAERLGYRDTDRLIIINADDIGLCHATNAAAIKGSEKGLISSIAIMPMTPGYKEIAEYAQKNPDKCFGTHLTHTCNFPKYKWKPLLSKELVPSLYAPDGYMWPTVKELYIHSNPSDAYKEGDAQIQKMLDDGIDVSYIDSHRGAMQLNHAFFMQYIRLARKYDLPLRMPCQEILEKHNAGYILTLLKMLDIVYPDDLVLCHRHYGRNAKEHWMYILKNLRPGVTEIYIHPAIETEKLKQFNDKWQWWVDEYKLFLNDPDIRKLIKEKHIKIISFKDLRDLQRGKKPRPKTEK